MSNVRNVEATYSGGKFETIVKRVFNGDEWEEREIDIPIDHKLLPIYKIENHNVDTNKLVVSYYGNKPILYEVTYRLGINNFETIVGHYVSATKDFRTIMFTHPTREGKTIGIPIMNIRSCERLK
jgi:hypothetical protein